MVITHIISIFDEKRLFILKKTVVQIIIFYLFSGAKNSDYTKCITGFAAKKVDNRVDKVKNPAAKGFQDFILEEKQRNCVNMTILSVVKSLHSLQNKKERKNNLFGNEKI
ncbi:MAG: hypothetical protein MJ173_09635 [Clostridia bacterium]|nr:hypothetical protein [Clostridia bacterium]